MTQLKHFSALACRLTMITIIMLIISSCGADDTKNPKEETVAADAGFKLNCVILEKTQIQKWVSRGWTDPTKPDSLIKKILLQFYSADATGANTNMQLAVFPAKKYLTVFSSGREDAAIDPKCTALSATGKAILGNNYLTIKDLDILDASGNLKDFTFIRLRPVQNRVAFGDYVTFEWEVVRIGPGTEESILKEGKTSDPCPTFCEEEEGIAGEN